MPPLLKPAGELVLLVKPQFEAGREQVGKKGVVKDPLVHIEVIERVADCARLHGLTPLELDFSPITGPEGNIEYLLHLAPAAEPPVDFSARVAQTVTTAHQSLQPGRR